MLACAVCGVEFAANANPRRVTCSKRCRVLRSKAGRAARRAAILGGLREAIRSGDLATVEALTVEVARLSGVEASAWSAAAAA